VRRLEAASGRETRRPQYDPPRRRRGGSGLGLAFGVEGFGGEFAVGFFQQDFDFALGFFELLLAFAGKLDAFLEKFHSVIEGELRRFETADDFFETGERAFKIGFLWRRRLGFFRCGLINGINLRDLAVSKKLRAFYGTREKGNKQRPGRKRLVHRKRAVRRFLPRRVYQ